MDPASTHLAQRQQQPCARNTESVPVKAMHHDQSRPDGTGGNNPVAERIGPARRHQRWLKASLRHSESPEGQKAPTSAITHPGAIPAGRRSSSLAALIANPSTAFDVSADQIPALVAELASEQSALSALQGALTARLLVSQADAATRPEPSDRLMTAEEVATALGVTRRWVQRRARRLPFARRISDHAIRYSRPASSAGCRIERSQHAERHLVSRGGFNHIDKRAMLLLQRAERELVQAYLACRSDTHGRLCLHRRLDQADARASARNGLRRGSTSHTARSSQSGSPGRRSRYPLSEFRYAAVTTRADVFEATCRPQNVVQGCEDTGLPCSPLQHHDWRRAKGRNIRRKRKL